MAEARVVVGSDDPLVYYLRRDGLIKIGYTAKFADRMRKLRPDELLAVEPGNIPLETGRHLQFAAYRVREGDDGREWYQPVPELLDHIKLMASIYTMPSLPPLRLKRVAAADAEAYDGPPITAEDLREFVGMSPEQIAALDAGYLVALIKRARAVQETIGPRAAELRRRGWTLARIGKAIGVDQSTVHRWAKPYLDEEVTP